MQNCKSECEQRSLSKFSFPRHTARRLNTLALKSYKVEHMGWETPGIIKGSVKMYYTTHFHFTVLQFTSYSTHTINYFVLMLKSKNCTDFESHILSINITITISYDLVGGGVLSMYKFMLFSG